jgi:lambda family phage portal protein
MEIEQKTNHDASRAPTAKPATRKVKASGYSEAGASRTKNAFKGFKAESLSPKLDIDYNNHELRSRSRMLCMSSPLAASAIRILRTNVVGVGIIPKPRLNLDILRMEPEQAFILQRQIETEWKLWAESKAACDATGMNDFYELQQLAYRAYRESGDTFCLFQWAEPTAGNPYSLRLHLLEADRICTPAGKFTRGGWSCTEGTNPANNNPIYDGVEVDRITGRAVAYWICNKHPYDYTEMAAREWERVEAIGAETALPNILHVMESERPGQYRGVPILAATMERILQINRFGEAVVSTAVMHAKQTMIIETEADPTRNPFDRDLEEEETEERAQTSAADIAIGTGAVNVLKPGEKMTAFNPAQPTSTYESFIRASGMEIGAAIEIPRGQLMKDFNSSYSATRGELLEFHKYVKMNQQWFIADFCRPIYERWFTEAVARGRIKAPGFFGDPITRAAYMGCEWIVPSFGQIDPTKEVQALKAAVDNGWTSNEAAARQYNGSDFYHNAIQLGREREAMGNNSAGGNTSE